MDKEQENLFLEPLEKHENHNEDYIISKAVDPLAINLSNNEFHSIEKRAQDLFEKNYFSQAVDLLQTLHSRGLGSAQSYCLLASSYHQLNQFQKALQTYKRALEMDENHLESLVNLSILRMDLGDYERGAITYKKAQQNYFKNTENQWERFMFEQHLATGRSYFEKGYFQEALLEFLKAKPKMQGTSLRVHIWIARSLWNLDRKKEAIEKLKSLKKDHPKYIEAPLLLGELYLLSHKVTAAVGELERVLKIDPVNQKALRLLSKTQTMQNSVEETDFA